MQDISVIVPFQSQFMNFAILDEANTLTLTVQWNIWLLLPKKGFYCINKWYIVVSARHINDLLNYSCLFVYCDQTQHSWCPNGSSLTGAYIHFFFKFKLLFFSSTWHWTSNLHFYCLNAILTFSHMMAAGMTCHNVSTRGALMSTMLNLQCSVSHFKRSAYMKVMN